MKIKKNKKCNKFVENNVSSISEITKKTLYFFYTAILIFFLYYYLCFRTILKYTLIFNNIIFFGFNKLIGQAHSLSFLGFLSSLPQSAEIDYQARFDPFMNSITTNGTFGVRLIKQNLD